MKRLPLAAALAAFAVFLVWSVSARQGLLFLVGIGLGAALAGARFGGVDLQGARVGVLISGGNVDLGRYAQLLGSV